MDKSSLDVWVVDDERPIRWVLEQALQSAGMRPRGFESAETMLEELAGIYFYCESCLNYY